MLALLPGKLAGNQSHSDWERWQKFTGVFLWQNFSFNASFGAADKQR
jgi:hypothetical protein